MNRGRPTVQLRSTSSTTLPMQFDDSAPPHLRNPLRFITELPPDPRRPVRISDYIREALG